MNSLGERLALARKRAGLRQDDVAAEFKISRVNVSQWESNTTKPDTDRLPILAKIYGTTVDWLMTGVGATPEKKHQAKPSLISSYDPDSAHDDGHEDHGYSRERWKPEVAGAIPEIDAKLGAGNGQVGEIINIAVGRNGSVSGHPVLAEWLLPEHFLRHELKVQTSQSIIQEVIGDSMVPTYQPGDRVIIDLTQNRLVSDAVYAISDGDSEPQIKRLQRVPFSDPIEVIIISDNPALEKFRVELSRLTIIGRVCGVVSRR